MGEFLKKIIRNSREAAGEIYSQQGKPLKYRTIAPKHQGYVEDVLSNDISESLRSDVNNVGIDFRRGIEKYRSNVSK
jgi:hypothetical protein